MGTSLLYWQRAWAGIRARKILLELFALALAAFTPGAGWAERESSNTNAEPVRVRIHWTANGVAFLGEGDALAISGDTLLFSSIRTRERYSSRSEFIGHTHGVYIPDLERIEIVEGSRGHAGMGALIGGGIGLVLGTLLVQSTEGDFIFEFPASTIPISGGIGALLGAGAGAIVRTGNTREVSREELQWLLERHVATLRSVTSATEPATAADR